jgi:hypothetical protein
MEEKLHRKEKNLQLFIYRHAEQTVEVLNVYAKRI